MKIHARSEKKKKKLSTNVFSNLFGNWIIADEHRTNRENLEKRKVLKNGEGSVMGRAEITDAVRGFMWDIVSSDSRFPKSQIF